MKKKKGKENKKTKNTHNPHKPGCSEFYLHCIVFISEDQVLSQMCLGSTIETDYTNTFYLQNIQIKTISKKAFGSKFKQIFGYTKS